MVKIYSVHDKRPDFIKYQAKTFKNLLHDEYEFIICDNAIQKKHSTEIKRVCKRYDLKYMLIPDQHHENPNIACSYPLDYLVQEILVNDNDTDISVFIDSDMFLMQQFSFEEFVENYKISGVYQQRENIYYLWNALVIFNHKKLSKDELKCIYFADSASQNSKYYPFQYYVDGKILGQSVDVGGPTYFFIKESGNEPKYISASRITEYYHNIDLLPEEIRDYYQPFYSSEFGKGEKSLVASDMLLDNHFFHYRAGSNWNGFTEKAILLKSAILEAMIQLALKGKVPRKSNDRIVPDA